MKNILATIFGIIFGVFFIGLIQWMGTSLFPASVPFPTKRTEFQTYLEHVPTLAKWFMILSFGVGGFVTGIVATFIQGRRSLKPTLAATTLLQLLTWMSLMSFPHPLWMWILGSIVTVPMGYLAYRLLKKPRIPKPLENTLEN